MKVMRIVPILTLTVVLMLGITSMGMAGGFCGPGTGSPGYWKNHPEAWPVMEITICDVTYTKVQAIEIMKNSVRGDKTYTMFKALVAAELNVIRNWPDGCIAPTIDDAQQWMCVNGPVGSGVAGRSSAWKRGGECLYRMLDAYNNGHLCVPSRDTLE